MRRLAHQFYFLRDRRLDQFYLTIFLRFFALWSVYIFLPVYLLLAGFSLQKIFLFYLLLRVFDLICIFLSWKIFSRFGQNFLILISLPILLAFYLGLRLISPTEPIFWLLAIFYGISNAFFWLGYHIDFAEFSRQKDTGKEAAFADILISLAGILAPVFSGFLIDAFGFSILFSLVILILLGASFFAIGLKKFEAKEVLEWKEIFAKKPFRSFLLFFGYGLEEGIFQVAWPLLAFAILKKFSLLGIMTALFSLLSIFFYWLVGSLFDRKNLKIMQFSALANYLIWLAKSFVAKPIQVFFLDSVHGLARGGIYVPFDAITYLSAKKYHPVSYIFFREISIALGFVTLYLILSFVPLSLSKIMLLAGLFSLTYFLLKLPNGSTK